MAVLGCVLLARPAQAADDSASALADSLFEEGKELLDAGRVSEACSRLEESQRLAPGGGTMLVLGICRAREGRTATAWTTLKNALALARRAGRQDRIELAERQMKELAKRLSYVVVIVSEASPGGEALITLDGVVLQRGGWNTPLMVDPGDHALLVSVAGHDARTLSVHVKEGESHEVDVPLPAPKVPTKASPRKTDGGASARITRPPREHSKAERSPLGAQRILALSLAGAAAVEIGAGTYFGVSAARKEGRKKETCLSNDSQCISHERRLDEQTDQAARWANLAFGLAAVTAGTSIYLYLDAPDHSAPGRRTAINIEGRAGPNYVGARLSGEF
jgi:hypothetical protein